MKTVLFIVLLGFGVTGLQGGENPFAGMEAAAKAHNDRSTAILLAPAPVSSAQNDKILAELKKQTALLEARRPIVIDDPTVKAVPVTQVPVR
jgi:hypothetical protein